MTDLIDPMGESWRDGPACVELDSAEPVLDCASLPDGVELFTDLANGHRLASLRGDDLRHTQAHGWLAWDGARYQRDATGAAERAAHETARALSRYAGALLVACPKTPEDTEENEASKRKRARAQAFLAWSRKSQDSRRMGAMLTVASALEGIAVAADAFDRDPMLLNCCNGTIDLRTGELLQPHRRADLLTRLSPVIYDPFATAPRWEAFLTRMLPDAEVRAFMQRWIGYCLTGRTDEQSFVVNWGASGDNGKSTFQNAVLGIVGEYAIQAAPDLLLAKKHESHPTEQADLYGRRLAICTEVEKGRAFAISTLKRLTGGDRLRARYMNRDFFEFDPTHKLMVACNDKPRVRGADHATWRRIHLVPWTVKIPPEEKDPQLGPKLTLELPGILRWAVDGCLAWQHDGLQVPAAVLAATRAYRDESDQLGRFLADCRDPNASSPVHDVTESTDVFKAFERWAQAEGEAPAYSQRSLALALESRAGELGIEKGKHDRTRRALWRGLRLLPEGERPAADPRPPIHQDHEDHEDVEREAIQGELLQ